MKVTIISLAAFIGIVVAAPWNPFDREDRIGPGNFDDHHGCHSVLGTNSQTCNLYCQRMGNKGGACWIGSAFGTCKCTPYDTPEVLQPSGRENPPNPNPKPTGDAKA